jgi:LCP family protein required for cell wall assembly
MKNPLQNLIQRAGPTRLVMAAILIVVSCLAATTSFLLLRQLALTWPGANQASGLVLNAEGTPMLNAEGTPLPGFEGEVAQPMLLTEVTPWDKAGRVTVLLLGVDYRDWVSDEGPARSDTMILLTLDPLTKTAGILSIPRDLWVPIPGFKHGKINTAYYLGDAYQLPGGGPALAIKTVEEFIGVPINYFAQVDFAAFVRFIDELGGVTIDVPQEIAIDLLGGGFKTKKTLPPGRQLLPGDWALAYARARYTEGGDFDRAARQQQVIMAIRERILRWDMLPTLVAKAPALYNELAASIRTNLSLDEVIQLAILAQSVPDDGIQRGIIGKESVLFANSPDELSILIPLPDKINLVRDQVFASAGGLGPQTPGSPQERMQAEQARIALYDGAGAAGILERTVAYLKGLGANITVSSAAAQPYTATTIIDHTGNPHTLKYLVDLLKIRPGRIYIEYDPNASVDVEVFLGSDWAASNNLP